LSAGPPRPGLSSSARNLLVQARSVLAESAAADSAADRFRLAHLSALRTAAVVFAERGRPASARRRLVSASSAWSEPTRPAIAPSTPASRHEGASTGSVGNAQR